MYYPEATFSLSVNTVIPARARVQGLNHLKDMPNQGSLSWSGWLTGPHGGSRNLDKMGGSLEKTVKTLHIGNKDVIKAMSQLPSTKHDLAAADKFILDAWPVGAGEDARLFVTVHGQFEECMLAVPFFFSLEIGNLT